MQKCECGHTKDVHSKLRGGITARCWSDVGCDCLDYRPAPADPPSGELAGEKCAECGVSRNNHSLAAERYGHPCQTFVPPSGEDVGMAEAAEGAMRWLVAKYGKPMPDAYLTPEQAAEECAEYAAAQTASLAARVEEALRFRVPLQELTEAAIVWDGALATNKPTYMDERNRFKAAISQAQAALAAADSGEGEK